MRENPVISDWVPVSGGSTEGSLGGWLAQRQAALREVMAAGALPTFTLGLPCVPVILRAACVPQRRIFWKAAAIAYRPATFNDLPKQLVAKPEQTASINRLKLRRWTRR